MTQTPSTDRPTPKLLSTGFMVGYDGSKPGETPRGGGWVLPEGGMDAVAELYPTFEQAEGFLGGRRATTDLRGKPATLRVFHVRVFPFPLGKGGVGYRTTRQDVKLRK